MNFLRKVKAQLEEAQNDLTKAAVSMDLNDKKELILASSSVAESQSGNSTTVNTPTTSVAFSIAEALKPKLPLTIRKNSMIY